MKKLIIYFLFLLFAVWLGLQIQSSSGYAFISYHNWSFETTLWIAVLSVLVVCLLLHYFLNALSFTFLINKRLRNWFARKRRQRFYNQTFLGLKELAEGSWVKAEKKLLRAAKKERASISSINYLAGAFAAQKQKAFGRRDGYLSRAIKIDQNSLVAANLTKAQLQISEEQWQDALITLHSLKKLKVKQPLLLTLLAKVYKHLQRFEELAEILPQLQKKKVFSYVEFYSLSIQAYSGLLQEFLYRRQYNSFLLLWKRLARKFRSDPKLLAIYVDYLLMQRQVTQVEIILRKALFKKVDSALFDKYCSLDSSNPVKQLKIAEKLLAAYPADVSLLLGLGKLCKRQKLWGQAQHYLQESLAIKENIAAYVELADMAEAQKDLTKSIIYYHKIINILKTTENLSE
jgi:HemY protein